MRKRVASFASGARRALGGVALCALSTGVFAADTPSAPRPEWCKAGWQCLQNAEIAAATERLVLLQAEVDALRWQQRHRVGRAWGQIGVEYLLNDAEYKPYAIGGLRIGRVTAWAGFFGDAPIVGVGVGF